MPFCPICKNEYREGVTHCTECRVPLVASLDDIPNEIFGGDEDTCKGLVNFLVPSGISTANMKYDENKEAYFVYVDNDEAEDAERFMKAYFVKLEMERLADKHGLTPQEITADKMKELQALELEEYRRIRLEEQAERLNNRVNYQNKHDTIEEWKSSAITLTLVGGVGLAWIILVYLGVFPGFAGLKKNYMFMGVMALMFFAFLVGGIITAFKTKELKALANVEDDMLLKVKEFTEKNFTKDIIESNIKVDKTFTDTELYFARAKYIEEKLMAEFPDMEPALREKLIEEKYSEIYENNDN